MMKINEREGNQIMEIRYIEQAIDKSHIKLIVHCNLSEINQYAAYICKFLNRMKIKKLLLKQGFISLLDDTTNTEYRIELGEIA